MDLDTLLCRAGGGGGISGNAFARFEIIPTQIPKSEENYDPSK